MMLLHESECTAMRDYFFITVDSERGIRFAIPSGELSSRFEDAAEFQYIEDAVHFMKEHNIKDAAIRELYGA